MEYDGAFLTYDISRVLIVVGHPPSATALHDLHFRQSIHFEVFYDFNSFDDYDYHFIQDSLGRQAKILARNILSLKSHICVFGDEVMSGVRTVHKHLPNLI